MGCVTPHEFLKPFNINHELVCLVVFVAAGCGCRDPVCVLQWYTPIKITGKKIKNIILNFFHYYG
jgi:hypothetical protein